MMTTMLLALIVLAAPPVGAGAETTEQRRARVERLEGSLLAPCCYMEPVSHHQSEVAIQMRLEIRSWVDEGKTDQEIVDTYKKRYGARVLIEPQGETWWWVNGVPCVFAGLGTAGLVWLLLRWKARAGSCHPTDAIALPTVPASEEDWAPVEPPPRRKR